MVNHIRSRYALPILIKKLKFSPVVLIQGARQTGKSFLVRKLLPEIFLNTVYKSLDVNTVRNFAEDNPDSFVRDLESQQTLIIDEAQKVPALFDSVKAVVDEERRPGKYILLGSTEFSRLTNIRESLTGRASKLKIFPMTLSETKHLPLNSAADFLNVKPRVERKELLKYLRNGGMPGIFGIKSDSEKHDALKDWLDLVSERDALSFENLKIESNLIKRILEAVATLDDSSVGAISKHLRVDLRKIRTHLSVLKTLFVIHEIEPHSLSTGKGQYFFCDVGLLGFFNSTFEKKIKTWVIQEIIAQTFYRDEVNHHLYFYRTAKGSVIDLVVVENEKILECIKISPDEKYKSKQFDLLRSFYSKNKKEFHPKSRLVGLCGSLERFRDDSVELFPWESIA